MLIVESQIPEKDCDCFLKLASDSARDARLSLLQPIHHRPDVVQTSAITHEHPSIWYGDYLAEWCHAVSQWHSFRRLHRVHCRALTETNFSLSNSVSPSQR